MSSSWIGWNLGTGLWSADQGLITLSILMEDTQVDKIARKNMENEKRAEKKKPQTIAFEIVLHSTSFLPESIFVPICVLD